VPQFFSSKKKVGKKELAPSVLLTSEFPGTTFGLKILRLLFSGSCGESIREKKWNRMPVGRLSGKVV
jgi:hypothetical protein